MVPTEPMIRPLGAAWLQPRALIRGVLGGILLALAASGSGGCERTGEPAGVAAQEGFIAFIGASADDPLWPTLSATAERFRGGLGGLDLRVAAPALRSPIEQIALLRSLQSSDMRGLCIEPADTVIMRDILCELQVKGVAIVTVMTPIACEDPLPMAGVDEMAVGQALADAVVNALAGKGGIAVMTQGDGSPALADRTMGFHERLRQSPAVAILREMDCGGKPIVAERMMRDYLERFPRLDAWVTLDNWPLREREAEGRLLPETCRLVTTAPYPRYWPLLYDGTCAALVGCEYERIAREALRMCVNAVRGEPLPVSHYLAPPVTVTIQNLNWYRQSWFEALRHPAPAPSGADTDGGD